MCVCVCGVEWRGGGGARDRGKGGDRKRVLGGWGGGVGVRTGSSEKPDGTWGSGV